MASSTSGGITTPLSLLLSCIVFCGSGSIVFLSTNPVQHQHTKHIKIDLLCSERVALGQVRVLYVASSRQRHLHQGFVVAFVSGFLVKSQRDKCCDNEGVLSDARATPQPQNVNMLFEL
jgi:hypothetical protein